MKNALRNLVRACLPASLCRWWRLRYGWRWFRGNYSSWAEARAASAGYDDAAVLARVVAAAREVKAGRAAFERDGFVFQHPAANVPLLSALRSAAQDSGGNLMVIDFGGSLGSTWWQHRAALAEHVSVRWRIVEQPHYVAAGAEFSGGGLSFHETIGEALGADPAHVVLFSGVLPYIEAPRELLAEVVRRRFPHVVIDRTPFAVRGPSRLVVQHTPPGLGGGSYPCRLGSKGELLAPLLADYRLVRSWPALDELAADVRHRGYHFQLRT